MQVDPSTFLLFFFFFFFFFTRLSLPSPFLSLKIHFFLSHLALPLNSLTLRPFFLCLTSFPPSFPGSFFFFFLFPSPSFWPVGKSKNLNNFYTTVGAKKLTRSSWEHSDPRATGAVSLGGKRDRFVFLDPVTGSPKGEKKRQLNIAASSSNIH